MDNKLSEQEILYSFEAALRDGHIVPYYQPQINHSTGRMVGAEALMRWNHLVLGFQCPADFIPVLEDHDLIFKADVYIFEEVCRFLRKCFDRGISPVPISVNMSRCDIYRHDYVEEIERIRHRYEIPVRYLHIEITESSAIAGIELMTSVIDKLHALGYIVEMDDFGSGYSSLNILKDLNVDVIKIDLGFLDGNVGGRGGIILSSVVQMAKWLNTPIISEGVETMEQADYMKSLGCDYIQGFLYAKPMPEEAFLDRLQKTQHEMERPSMQFINAVNTGKFWDPDSMETLIFSHFVGPAALFTYQEGKLEILRVNDKYIREIGMNMTPQDFINANPWDNHDAESRKRYEDVIRRAIVSGEEETCEAWRQFFSPCCGKDEICIRSYIQIIGHAGTQHLLFARIQNVTAEKNKYQTLSESEQRFRFASEQANIYAWEYTIATKEMRPCFRCMRDMDLPPLLTNYPEPVIESGVIPEDYADMYRDWMRRLEAGEPSLEGVIPFTKWRVPFLVRYTTVFDENGKPLKAYGSATMVVNPAKEEK